MGDALKKLADILASKQVESTEPVIPTPVEGGYNPNLTNDITDVIMQKYGPKVPYRVSTDPTVVTPGMPNPKYNTTDMSSINVDDEALNSTWTNAWNNFKQGIDSIQIATEFGKMNLNGVFGDAPYKILDEYDKNKATLDNLRDKGKLSAEQYNSQLEELDKNRENARRSVGKSFADIRANEVEIANEPVAKDYKIKSYLTQLQGDQSSLSDRFVYTMPQVLGSSMSLVAPQIAATFGSNITKAVIETAAASLFTEGIATAVGVIGAIGMSVAEVAYGRYQESYGEVGSTIMAAQEKMMNQYMSDNGLSSVDDIPEEIKKEIRIQSRKGADMQFKENMALAAVDIAQAILMPLSSLGGTVSMLGKTTQKVADVAEAARNYNKITRVLSTVGKFGANAMAEKFEEGFQYAAGKRAEDTIDGTGEFDSKGFIGNVFADGYDTAASLNYSLIPGIDLRGSGKYSQDKEFQFSENSGAMLGALMGAVPTGISLYKDIKGYIDTKKAVSNNGLEDVEGRLKGLKASILKTYFDKDQAHHLEQAVLSLVGKKDEQGNEILSKENATEIVQDMRQSFVMYNSITRNIERNIGKDTRMGLKSSPQLLAAKEMLKEDALKLSMNIVAKEKLLAKIGSSREAQFQSEYNAKNPRFIRENEYGDRVSQLEAINEMLDEHSNDTSSSLTPEEKRSHIQFLNDAKKGIEEELAEIKSGFESLKSAGSDMNSLVEPSADLIELDKQIYAQTMYELDARVKYAKLSKIKTREALDAYVNEAKSKPIDRNSPLKTQMNTPEPTEVPVPEPVEETEVKDNVSTTPTQTPKSTQTVTGDPVDNVDKGEGELDKEYEQALMEAGQEAKAIIETKQGAPAFEEWRALYFPDYITIPDIIGLLRFILPNDEDFIKNNFDEIQSLVKANDPSVETYEMDKVDMSLYQPTNIPPTQGDAENVDNLNQGIIDMVEEIEDTKGTPLKITSSLTLANANVAGYLNPSTNRWYNQLDDNGKIIFSENDHQQLVNTNLVNVGDTIYFKLEDVPENFNPADTSYENYDKLVIGMYARVSGDGVTQNLRIGAVHEIKSLDRLLSQYENADQINIEEERERLQSIRTTVFSGGKDATFETTVTKKGFGYLNKNSPLLQTTVANAIGKDTRPFITVLNKEKVPSLVDRDITPRYSTSDKMKAGATMIMLPNETAEGTVYMPFYLKKGKIGADTAILDKVYDSIVAFLGSADSSQLNVARDYVHISRSDSDKAALGKGGIFVGYKGDNTDISKGVQHNATVMVNNQIFDGGKIEGLREALAETYFTARGRRLTDPTYQAELMNSPILTTNITQNTVLRDRADDYTFLEPNQQYSYFSQHSIYYEGITQSLEKVEAKRTTRRTPTPEAPEVVINTSVEAIEAKRREELEANGLYNRLFPLSLDASDAEFKDIVRLKELQENINTKYDAELAALNPSRSSEYKDEVHFNKREFFVIAPAAAVRYDSETFNTTQKILEYATSERDREGAGESRKAEMQEVIDQIEKYRNYAISKNDIDDYEKNMSELAQSPEYQEWEAAQREDSIRRQIEEGPEEDDTPTKSQEDIDRELNDSGWDFGDDISDDLPQENPLDMAAMVRDLLGLEVGKRYTEEEVNAIRAALAELNADTGKFHTLITARDSSGRYAVHIHIQRDFLLDDLEEGNISPDIPLSIQRQMVESVAYMLLNNERPDSTDTEKLKNEDRVRAHIQKGVDGMRDWIKLESAKPNLTQEDLERIDNRRRIMSLNQLLLDNYDGVIAGARGFLENLGFTLGEEDDYYERLEEVIDGNDFQEFGDEASRTRNHTEDLSPEVKKLIYFIPQLRAIDPDSKVDQKWLEQQKKLNPTAEPKNYRQESNDLGLPYFNNFNDTWEKVLYVVSGAHYPPDKSGFDKMVNRLRQKDNFFVVRYLGDLLAKKETSEQIKRAFFRRANLQNQRNVTMLYNLIDVKKTPTEEELALDPFLDARPTYMGTKKTASITQADRRQAERNVLDQLENEFRIYGVKTGILSSSIDTITGKNIVTVNLDKAKQITDGILAILDNDASYKQLIKEGTNMAPVRGKLLEESIKAIYEHVLDTGINMSYSAFSDFANSHTINDKRDAALNIRSVFVNGILATLRGDRNVDSNEGNFVSYKQHNPFSKDRQTMLLLAKFEHKYRIQRQAGSYRLEGKSYYSYTRHNMLSSIFTQIREMHETKGKEDTFAMSKLVNDRFASHSKYLKLLKTSSAFRKDFVLSYELGARNTSSDNPIKLLKDMTDREHEITKLSWYQNNGKQFAAYMYDTLSDKSTKPMIEAKRYSFGFTFVEGRKIGKYDMVKLAEESMAELYTYYQAEFDRINDVRKQNATLPKHELIKGYHDIGNKEGMGKYFNIFYFLNKAILDGEKNPLSGIMYNEDGSFKPVTEDVKKGIEAEINLNFNLIFAKVRGDFERLKLYTIDDTLEGASAADKTVIEKYGFKADLTDLMDAKYFSGTYDREFGGFQHGVVEALGLNGDPMLWEAVNNGRYEALGPDVVANIVDYVIGDYLFNTMIFSNEMLMLTGDPAQAGKLAGKGEIKAIEEKHKDAPLVAAKEKLIANIKSTFVNLGKRNAAFLASGESAMFDTAEYNVSIANDIKINSPQLDEYKERFKGSESSIQKAYGDGDLTDAQEVTTVREHLHVMKAYGDISPMQYKKALYIYDEADYRKEFGDEDVVITAQDKVNMMKIIMQPMKPVQRTYVIDGDLKISKQYYIKTSSYPIIPALVRGTPLEDLLNDMKKNEVQRIAFESGVKQGVAGSKDMFDENGQYNTKFFENNVNTLNRSGFRIQLQVPYKATKGAIREGTQMSKLLFVDINDNLEVSFQGKTAKISELREKFVQYHGAIIDIQRKKLLEEIGILEGVEEITFESYKKLSDILRKEAMGRGYAGNSVRGLELANNGRFKIPLTFLPNAGQIEPVITAIVSNRIARLKMPGKSYVQGSEFVLNSKGKVAEGTELDKRGIVWTKAEYSGTPKLKYMRVENGEVKPAQIVMPFYFINGEERVDLTQYTVSQEGKTVLNTEKIDPELLALMGFRIPFQGHNSGMWFEVVGFLPEVAGDLILVPGEIAGQMGSDYDVDKLYSYMYAHSVDDKGVISKVKSTEPSTIEQYQNALIDIHKSIFTSNDPELIKAILLPLAFDDIEDAIQHHGPMGTSTFYGAYDPIYQRDTYFSNLMGKGGTAISANANTSHALAQQSNLFIKGQGVMFRDENGSRYDDSVDNASEIDDNGVNERTLETYEYEQNVPGGGMDIVDQNISGTGAWRLDKIYTFPNPVTGKRYVISNIISQILGISVDNAKEQKLGAFGINRHNFNTTLTIIRTGFDHFWAMAFINQPILREYYKRIGETEDMYNVQYVPNKKEKVVEDLYDEYAADYGISEMDMKMVKGTPDVEAFNFKELSENMRAKVTSNNALMQVQVLKAFLRYKAISDALQNITSTFNVDVKGLPKNISETAEKEIEILQALETNSIGNIRNYVSSTIPGLFLDVPTLATDMFLRGNNPVFAYKSAAYQQAIYNVSQYSGRMELNQERLDTIHNNIKQFIYSGFAFPNVDKFDVESERARLVFDYEALGTKSVQTRVLELKADPRYSRNELLGAINVISSKFTDDPKLVEIQMSNEDDYVQKVSEHWEHALYSDDEPELQSVARDLVKYALYIMPQEFGTTNIIKYIPFGYLEEIGFTEHLDNINTEVQYSHDLLENFGKQFLQHDVDFLLTAREKRDMIPGSIITNSAGVIEKFTLPVIDPKNLGTARASSLVRTREVGGQTQYFYPRFLAVYINEALGKQIYEQTIVAGVPTFYRIEKLSSNGMSQYAMDKADVRTIVVSDYVEEKNIGASANAIIAATNAKSDSVIQEKRDSRDYLTEGMSPYDMLHKIITVNDDIVMRKTVSPTNLRYAELFSWLAKEIQATNAINTRIIIDPEHQTTATTASDGSSITFNPTKIKTGRTGLLTELEKQRSVLHEFLHVAVYKGDKRTKEWADIVEVWNTYRK
jgi:hypothetical protein